MSRQPFVSVIVPVYNGANFLPRSLDALFASDYAAFEVIAVDDGSTDDTARLCLAKGARLLGSERPQSGPAAARNLAAQAARGDVLLFVDADVVVEKNTVSKIAARFREQAEIAAVFGSYDDAPDAPDFVSQYRNLLHHFVHQHSNPEATTFWAGLGAVRKDVFLAVGGFDCEKFPFPSIEDIELGARLHAAGHRILLDREIQGKHLKKWTAAAVLKTDVFRRALPWSRLILTEHGLINDLNLKTSDRLSALLVAVSLAVAPMIFWQPLFLILLAALLLSILCLNRRIFRFFRRKRGLAFAARAFPWQLLYFFYSGATFTLCWLWYVPARRRGLARTQRRDAARLSINDGGRDKAAI